MATATQTWTIPQLLVARSLRNAGWPADVMMRGYLLTRNGAAEADLAGLLANGWAKERDGRLRLTRAGEREYKAQAKGRYF